MLVTVKVEDFDRFLETFSTKGAEKRKEHGSKGATVFRDPEDEQRVLIVYDWTPDGLRSLQQSPDSSELFKAAGLQGPPTPLKPAAELPS